MIRATCRARRALSCLLVLASIAASDACTYYRLELRRSRMHAADAIVVLGQRLTHEGTGSTILWNRMRMAKLLLDEGWAPRLIVTGDQERNGVTEADKMVEYGLALGIPAELMEKEPRARTTVENASYSAELMVQRGWTSALVVTGQWHLCYGLPVFRDAFYPRGLALYWAPVDLEKLQGRGASEPPDLPARE